MKITAALLVPLFAVAAVSEALGQRQATLAPSPTESIGCEPHGDHWYGRKDPAEPALSLTMIVVKALRWPQNHAGLDLNRRGRPPRRG